jgi:hypothetical protein
MISYLGKSGKVDGLGFPLRKGFSKAGCEVFNDIERKGGKKDEKDSYSASGCFMIASVAYAAKKVMITKSNVASLKGAWQGVASLGATAQENSL